MHVHKYFYCINIVTAEIFSDQQMGGGEVPICLAEV